jgi:hypothetical protein
MEQHCKHGGPKKYAVIRSGTQEAYEVAMHSKLASDWELFVTAQTEQEMKRLKRALVSHGMPTHSLWRAWIWKPGGQQSNCATRDRIHARK